MQTAFIIIGSIVFIVIVLRFWLLSKMKNVEMVDDHEKILTLTDQNFQQQTKNRLVLIDFWAAWCAPCRMMAPVLNEVASEIKSKSRVGKVDIQQYQDLANRFKIRSIPTMILLKDGKEVARFVGVKSKEFLLNEIAKAE